MKIKKWVIALLIVIVVIIAGVVSFNVIMEKYTSAYNDFNFSAINMGTIEDGTYTGSEDGNIVKASVEVTVKDHTITDIKILSHECGTGKPAEAIVEDIVEENSLEVDTISGATYSCNVIKVAVYHALNGEE
ncbi:MAG: uncharacterized protein K0S76_548 [Herbinix sp.]|jgi:uncharacterized protein with FMN-binding domain|nr:uncharacterized protein [Herbinix sp.]